MLFITSIILLILAVAGTSQPIASSLPDPVSINITASADMSITTTPVPEPTPIILQVEQPNNIVHTTLDAMDTISQAPVKMARSLIIVAGQHNGLSQPAIIAISVILGFCAIVAITFVVLRCIALKQMRDAHNASDEARDIELGDVGTEPQNTTAEPQSAAITEPPKAVTASSRPPMP
ncbi:hypothetical protein F5Y10DRAFT_241048 [Nemania abortiva]|nr:hypothetical protein F5Y10DRAFT_241048 [Nemania abortiva]